MLRKRDTQGGFTLIELSIVLVIIGLLVGGVVKGQELISQARANKVQQELQQLATAVMNYETRFGVSPIRDTRFGGGAAVNTGWRNLRRAGLWNDNLDDHTAPSSSISGAAAGFEIGRALPGTQIAGWGVAGTVSEGNTVICALNLSRAEASGIAGGMAPSQANYTAAANLVNTTTATAPGAALPTGATATAANVQYNVCVRLP